MTFVRKHLLFLISSALLCLLLGNCAPHRDFPLPHLENQHYQSYDGRKFPIENWSQSVKKPEKIIIALHGYNGYPGDFKSLGQKLSNHSIIVYAPATRGQGLDPIPSFRGDIKHADQWIDDLRTLTRLLRTKHPNAEIIWLGESMGGLIALNAASSSVSESCDRMIIAAPILTLGDQITNGQRNLLNVAGFIFPKMRFSLETLTGSENTQMTASSQHDEQSLKNPWHIHRQSLRLYRNLERLIEMAPQKLNTLQIPLLTLRGAKDRLSDERSLRQLFQVLPPDSSHQHIEYEKSHHLLFYDQEKKTVMDDIAAWLRNQ